MRSLHKGKKKAGRVIPVIGYIEMGIGVAGFVVMTVLIVCLGVSFRRQDRLCKELEHKVKVARAYNIAAYSGRIMEGVAYYSVYRGTGTPTQDEVIKYVHSLGVWYPKYIIAQAILESHCGQDDASGSHNLFGMCVPHSRVTTAYNMDDEGYCRYKNWQLSVLDRVLWEYYVFGGECPEEDVYLDALRGYAEDSSYVDKVVRISRRLK